MRRQKSAKPPKRVVNRSGASPLPNRRDWHLNSWNFKSMNFSGLIRLLKYGVYIGLISAIVVALQGLNPRARIDQFMNRPIAGVSVESEFKYIAQEATQEIVAAHLPKTFLELDMLALKQALEANPWIDKVMIARTWPDRLVVHIQEQKPIARWGDTGFLNMRGEIINVKTSAQLSGLPVFNADEHYAKQVMQQYLLIKNITSANGLTPDRIDMDNTLAWTVHFTPELKIALGRDRTLEKLQNIAKILRTDLAREIARIDTIDMRYDNGFAVSWRDGGSKDKDIVTTTPSNPKLMAVNAQQNTAPPPTISPAAE